MQPGHGTCGHRGAPAARQNAAGCSDTLQRRARQWQKGPTHRSNWASQSAACRVNSASSKSTQRPSRKCSYPETCLLHFCAPTKQQLNTRSAPVTRARAPQAVCDPARTACQKTIPLAAPVQGARCCRGALLRLYTAQGTAEAVRAECARTQQKKAPQEHVTLLQPSICAPRPK